MKTGAIITAAGLSSRMGKFKPMIEIGSMSMIKRLIAAFRETDSSPIVVVTGHNAEGLRFRRNKRIIASFAGTPTTSRKDITSTPISLAIT